MIERSIAVTLHGRYLVEPPRAAGAVPLLIGFHGYAEPAELQLERLRGIPDADRWLLVAVQGLHRFYRGRSEDVVASWMTRQDRELLMADNRAFVVAVLAAIEREWGVATRLVFAGFSQGVAMAFRAACAAGRDVAGVIACGGDVPPEISRDELRKVNRALLGRGARDEWYSAGKLTADVARLRAAEVDVRAETLDAGHEWTPAFSTAAGQLLENVRQAAGHTN
jgi:predicted esterase